VSPVRRHVRLGAAPTVVISLEVGAFTEPELRQEILKRRRRVEKLAALLRLALALLHTAGFNLSGERLPGGPAKLRILRAVERARESMSLRVASRTSARDDTRSKAMRPAAELLREKRECAGPLRVHPSKPKVGLRATGPDEIWHIDTTGIRLLGGATRSASIPLVLADAGVENINAQVDELIATGVLRRLLAFTELKFSNSMIAAWWRSLKHQWLFLHPLESAATIRRLLAFYVHEHNHVLPHSRSIPVLGRPYDHAARS
jgi:hypothetical protein